jgi:selenophosphate synthetase-related protein
MPETSSAPGVAARAAELHAVIAIVRAHQGLRHKSAIRLVTEVLGPSDWVSGPGDDAAAVDALGAKVIACGEALWPALVRADPFGAGVAAVLTNVNDVAATGGVTLGIVDTIVATAPVARSALAGMRHAGALYGVPILGGHLTVHEGPPSLSAFAVGTTRNVLSATRVRAGQSLLLACALEGRMRADFPFYGSFEQRGGRCAGDVRVLADLAEAGVCVAAKDVSMAGLVGSLAMLLEWSRLGATVDLDALPRPDGVPTASWVTCFPSFAFLLCAPAGAEAACIEPFTRRGLHAGVIGRIDGTGEISLALGGHTAVALNVADEPVTGLERT